MRLPKVEFYDPEEDIFIRVTLSGVSAEVMANLTEEHRRKLEPFVYEETLVLARRYSTFAISN